jgi:hypothetical protein
MGARSEPIADYYRPSSFRPEQSPKWRLRSGGDRPIVAVPSHSHLIGTTPHRLEQADRSRCADIERLDRPRHRNLDP